MSDAERLLATAAALGTYGEARDNAQPATPFSKLSETAQDIICGALLGEFEKTGPPAMTDEVKAEIAGWIGEPEGQA